MRRVSLVLPGLLAAAGLVAVLAAGGAALAGHHHGAPTSGPVFRGPYAGVIPGEPNPPPRPVKPGTTPATVTWPGFQMTPDGGSRVFLQLTSPVEYTTAINGKSIVITLAGARLHLTNNGRKLETQFFQTPVLSAQVKPVSGGVNLVLALRETAAPTVHLDASPTGYSFLFVDFAPWAPASEPASNPASP